MGKLISTTCVLALIASGVYGAQETLTDVSAYTAPKLVEQINDALEDTGANFDELYAADVATGLLTDIITAETSAAGAKIVLPEGTTNGANTMTIQAPASLTTNYTITIPDGDVDLSVIIAGGTLPAVDGSSLTGVALDTEVWGAAGITEGTNALVNTVAIQAKDIAAGDLSGYRVLHVWLSETDVGVASTNNIETLALSTGTAVSTVTAEADYWYVTAAAGTATATVTATAAGTNYLMVVDGSVISSQALTFY